MAESFPYLALDSAGERTILCDYPVKMFDDTTKKETTKMKTLSASDAATYAGLFVKNRAVANRFWAKCMGQDSAMGDETVEKLKAFLQSKLRPEDHAAACALMDGGEELPAANGEADDAGLAADAEPDFFRRFPGAARIRIDTSGIQPPARAASYSADGAKSFFELFPDARRINLA